MEHAGVEESSSGGKHLINDFVFTHIFASFVYFLFPKAVLTYTMCICRRKAK